jgi:hypothetical protein
MQATVFMALEIQTFDTLSRSFLPLILTTTNRFLCFLIDCFHEGSIVFKVTAGIP